MILVHFLEIIHIISLYFLLNFCADDLGKQEQKDAENELHENNENKNPKAELEEKPTLVIFSAKSSEEKEMPLQEECKVSATFLLLLIFTISPNFLSQ